MTTCRWDFLQSTKSSARCEGDFLVELVKAFKMKKVTESILVSALRKCFPAANLSVVVAFASKVAKTMSWCRSKGKSVTSGAKTTRAALRIINKMKIWPLPPAKPSVGKKLQRSLKRKLSDASAQSAQQEAHLDDVEQLLNSQGDDLIVEEHSPVEIHVVSSQEPASSSADDAKTRNSILALYSHTNEGDKGAQSVSSPATPLKDPSVFSKPAHPLKDPTVCQYTITDGVVRTGADGREVKAHMRPGAGGFAMASFSGSENEFETEIPNVALPEVAPLPDGPAVMKRPATKRPAAADEAVVDAAPAAADAAPAAAVADEAPDAPYHTMWYKNSNGFGIRAKGGKQLLAVTKKRASYDQLQAIALECIRRLAAGQDLATVVAWKSGELSRL